MPHLSTARTRHGRRLIIPLAVTLSTVGAGALWTSSPVAAAATSTTLVSSTSTGAPGTGRTESQEVDGAGSLVVMETQASNLALGTSPTLPSQIALKDLSTGGVSTVSLSPTGAAGDGYSLAPSTSADGRYVVFESVADNLVAGDTNGQRDIFLRDRTTGTTEREDLRPSGVQTAATSTTASVSDDGRYVSFLSLDSGLAPGDATSMADVFVRDRQTGKTSQVDVSTTGAAADSVAGFQRISGNGRYVVFSSDATNLVPGDVNGVTDVFRHDNVTGQTVLVSVATSGLPGDGISGGGALDISPDGRFVAFTSEADNLVAGDVNQQDDVFVRDMTLGLTSMVSVTSTGAQDAAESSNPTISADGRFVAFSSFGALVAGPASPDGPRIFVRDLARSQTTLVSGAGTPAYTEAQQPMLSNDGRYISFLGVSSGGQTMQAYLHDAGPVAPAPAVTITSGPATGSTDVTPTFTFTSPTATHFQCSVSAGAPAYSPCTSPFTAPSLSAGNYVFAVRGVDATGLTGMAAAYPFPIQGGTTPAACQTATHDVTGTAAADQLVGTKAGDLISGLDGDDTLTGKAGDDCLMGGTGNDTLTGAAGNDDLVGGDGNDRITPGPGQDIVDAGAGDDTVFARDGAVDRVDCGPGNDTVTADATDLLVNCEKIHLH